MLHGTNIITGARVVVVGRDQGQNWFLLHVRPEAGGQVTKLNETNFRADAVQPNHDLSNAIAFSYHIPFQR